ncbi:hypothetical protein C922_04757 [Plasmodium inui San Antonio 1]|uniref:Uncharacterized protein n=1 Tax=Plasmodium inui San Antonio 1 TaxID=1237626 RepID=W7A048_9APIC|nr:hypothetical protein C922_04757 [Plasmodium inui San Antonio 1]EUD64913.1 hypothetical protein C922_04757 [Plasmodium inui San Antonio 1]
MGNLTSTGRKHIRWDLLCREFWERISTAKTDRTNYPDVNFLLQELAPRDHERDFRYMLLYLQSYVKRKTFKGQEENLIAQLVNCILNVWFCAGVANPFVRWERVTHAVGITTSWEKLQNTVKTGACAAIQQAPPGFTASGIFSQTCPSSVNRTSNLNYDCTGYFMGARLNNRAPDYRRNDWVKIRDLNIPQGEISVWLKPLPVIPLLILAAFIWNVWDKECPDSYFSRRRR